MAICPGIIFFILVTEIRQMTVSDTMIKQNIRVSHAKFTVDIFNILSFVLRFADQFVPNILHSANSTDRQWNLDMSSTPYACAAVRMYAAFRLLTFLQSNSDARYFGIISEVLNLAHLNVNWNLSW